MSSGESNPQSAMSGPLLSPEQFSPDIPFEVPRTFENLHLMAPNRQHDLLPHVGALSPPRTVQYQPQLTPESNSSTLPHLQRKALTHTVPDADGGNEVVPQPDRFQSTLETLNQSEFIPVILKIPF